MGKTIIIIGVVIALILSVIIFLMKDDTSPKDQYLNTVDNEPRVTMEDFAIFSYVDQKIEGTFSAKLGHFLDPNIVEAFTTVRGVRYRPKNRVESLRCGSVTAYLVGDSMSEIVSPKGAEVARAEVEDQVRIGFDDHFLNTEFAEYVAATNLVTSNERVQVDGPNRTLFGEDGFSYNLKKEALEMQGAVSGVVTPENK